MSENPQIKAAESLARRRLGVAVIWLTYMGTALCFGFLFFIFTRQITDAARLFRYVGF